MTESAVLKPRTFKEWRKLAITVLSAAVAVLYLYLSYAGQLPTYQQRGIALAYCFVVIFVTMPMLKKGRPWWTIVIDICLSAATVMVVYRLVRIELTTPATGVYIPNTFDYILGVGLVVAVLEATRRTVGMALPILAIVAILYALFGSNLPGMFKHSYITPKFALQYLSMTTEGIWGLPVYVATTALLAFLILSALLHECGVLKFFMNLSNGLVGRYRGGSAKISILGSTIVGTMSGSAVANVAAVGPFTIPLMKKAGFSPTYAAAVESCASTGGVVTPPVMGATAFLIAEYLGVSYWAVCIAAIVPVALYYFGLYVSVDLEAMKTGLKGLPKDQVPSAFKEFIRHGYMLLPIGVLIFFLGFVRSSAMLAGFWATISVVALGIIGRDTRRNILGFGLIKGLAGGIESLFSVITVCACAGIVVGTLVATGLGFRLGSLLVELSGGNLLLLLLVAAAVNILLGMGMNTTSVYLMLVMVMGPALIKLGVLPMAAHLFIFFLGNLSHITPPVCIAVYVAGGLAGSPMWATGWQACKLGAILFILPFFFVFEPALIMQGSILNAAYAGLLAMVGVIFICFALSNFSWFGKINLVQRIMFGVGGLLVTYPNFMSVTAGGVLVVLGTLVSLIPRLTGAARADKT